MGGRVTQSGSGDLARARRLKTVLDSGASPIFVPAENAFPRVPEPSSLSRSTASASDVRFQYLEPLFQASPDALSISDCEHRVLWSNQAFSRMFGYDSNEILGQPLEDLVVSPDRLPEALWLRESVAKGQSITLETQRRKKDGSLIHVAVSSAPLIVEGKMAGFYAGYHDISDRKRVEALSSALYRVAEQSSSAQDL